MVTLAFSGFVASAHVAASGRPVDRQAWQHLHASPRIELGAHADLPVGRPGRPRAADRDRGRRPSSAGRRPRRCAPGALGVLQPLGRGRRGEAPAPVRRRGARLRAAVAVGPADAGAARPARRPRRGGRDRLRRRADAAAAAPPERVVPRPARRRPHRRPRPRPGHGGRPHAAAVDLVGAVVAVREPVAVRGRLQRVRPGLLHLRRRRQARLGAGAALRRRRRDRLRPLHQPAARRRRRPRQRSPPAAWWTPSSPCGRWWTPWRGRSARTAPIRAGSRPPSGRCSTSSTASARGAPRRGRLPPDGGAGRRAGDPRPGVLRARGGGAVRRRAGARRCAIRTLAEAR
jgi:hypothetical protein